MGIIDFMNIKILIATLLLSTTLGMQLNAKSTLSILQTLADGDKDKDKKDDDDGNSTETKMEECAAEGEFCECDGDIIYGAMTKDHKLNSKTPNGTKHAQEGEAGLNCSADNFGDPFANSSTKAPKGCFCTDQNVTKKNKTHEHDIDDLFEEQTWGQIKLVGNNDGRTVMINTTERNITATLSTHLSLGEKKTAKRPAGNKRNGKQKFAFVVSVKGRKGVCTFWEKHESPNGEGWNIV